MNIPDIATIGSYIGLLSGIFLLFDRLFRHRPHAAFVIEDESATNPTCVLRIENVTDRDFVITGMVIWPKIYQLMRDKTVQAAVDAAMSRPIEMIVGARSYKDIALLLKLFNKQDPEEKNRSFLVAIFWRSCGSPWLPQIPLIKIANTHFVRRLKKAGKRQAAR